jgi:16S rRNA (cytosine967-C5)-methyltransferase
MTPAPATARGVALAVLLDTRPGDFAHDRLDDALRHTPLSPADRRLATELVYGTLRRRGSLDALLRALIDRPRERIQPVAWELLRLGAYQLAYLTHVPPHAALYETVELAKTWVRHRAPGFVNGVLRGLTRLLTGGCAPGPAADALPLTAGAYRRLAKPVLPDPAQRPGEYLAAGHSLPRWLADRWLARWGWDEAVRLGFWFAEPAPLWLRVNPLRATRDQLRDALAAADHAAEPGPHPQSLRLAAHAPVRDLPGYADGWFTVQDHAAMTVASSLAPVPGMTVLDLCAAPGGKTTHLAELMHDRGRVVACDVDERRLRTVRELCGRLGVTIVEPVLLASGAASAPRGLLPLEDRSHGALTRPRSPDEFDAALVDVPCSNTGVLGRRPEARWRLAPADLRELVPLQTRLLLEACARVRPGGAVVYSTCSIEPEENGGVVRAALVALPGWALEAEQDHRPGLPADGGYWARLRRAGYTETRPRPVE